MNLRLSIFSKSALLSVLTGVLLILALPPLNLSFLAWIGLIPLFYALEQTRQNGFLIGFIGGLVFNTGAVHWLAFNSGTYPAVAATTMFAAALVLATGWGLSTWLFKAVLNRMGHMAWLVAPISWTVWEGWLSYLLEIAFPWPLLALTQAGFEPILQVMEFTGIWGVSFWVVSLNLILYMIWQSDRKAKRIYFAVCIAWAFIPFFAMQHAYSYYKQSLPTIDVAVVQGNVDPAEKWSRSVQYSYAIYDSLTRIEAIEGVDLVIWPETAVPANLAIQSYYSRMLAGLADDMNAAIVTGATTRQQVRGEIRPLNVAYLIKPAAGVSDVYAKQWLVPFGERVPFQWIAPQLGKLNLGQAEFMTGLRQSIFEVQANGTVGRFPALICYESAFPQLTRKAVNNGANFLVTISNDAWYGRTSELIQIATLSRFRCIETRRSMARVSNTGISFLADPLGRIISGTEIGVKDYKAATLPLLEHKTVYVKFGNWFLLITTLAYAVILAVCAFTGSARQK